MTKTIAMMLVGWTPGYVTTEAAWQALGTVCLLGVCGFYVVVPVLAEISRAVRWANRGKEGT